MGLAATALPAAGDEDASARHLPGIAAGTTTATLAWAAKKPATSPLVADRRPDRHARTRGHALHDADDDRVHAVQVADDAVQALCEVVDELLAVVRGGEAAHVALDAEDPALAPQQDDAGVVGTGTPNGTEQLRDHLLVQRMPLSPAERVMRAAPSVNS
ncbi:MAG: hypothetical protein JWQ37_581 [Blastococcus sp.]|nr:hypothetical protein [Blastococcus sp.]